MTDTNIYVVTVSGLDGPDPKFDAAGGALLFGVSVEQIKAAASAGTTPAEWVKSMRRRANEAFAATGGEDLLDILDYWARVDHQAELVLVAE